MREKKRTDVGKIRWITRETAQCLLQIGFPEGKTQNAPGLLT